MKSSFILHLDSLCILDKLTDEQAGRLFKAIYQYQQTKDLPTLDVLLDMVITPFINQFIRDELRYEETSEERRLAGSLGGKKRAENLKKRKQDAENHKGYSKSSKCLKSKQNQANVANQADSDSDSDSDSVNDSDSGSVKESKKVFTPPTIEEVKEYFKEHGYSESSAIKAYGYYNAGNWKDSEGKQVKSWKQKMQGVWFKDENKTPVVQMNSLGATGTSGRNYDPNNPRNKW
jgi:hypothetical protein